MKIKMSAYRITPTGKTLNKVNIPDSIITISNGNARWFENPVLAERLQQEYEREHCKGTPDEKLIQSYTKIDNCIEINGHYVVGFEWGHLCLNTHCEQRVCADTLSPSFAIEPFITTSNPSLLQLRKNKTAMQTVLKRPLPPGPITLFKALYEAGQQSISRETLITEMRWNNKKSFDGLLKLSISGKRLAKIPELAQLKQANPKLKLISFILDEGYFHGKQLYYSMCRELYELIKADTELQALMNFSFNEIHARSLWYPEERNERFYN